MIIQLKFLIRNNFVYIYGNISLVLLLHLFLVTNCLVPLELTKQDVATCCDAHSESAHVEKCQQPVCVHAHVLFLVVYGVLHNFVVRSCTHSAVQFQGERVQ